MSNAAYEIRVCTACGLRYPRTSGQASGTRCPSCMGNTRLVLSRNLLFEPQPDLPGNVSAPHSKDHPQLDETQGGHQPSITVLLDNIRSAWNVGSILRTADGFGLQQAFLCGITPTPDNDAVKKTALGAEDSVPWSYHKDAVQLVEGLKKDGWQIVALEESPQARPIQTVNRATLTQPAVVVVGNEITGLDPGLLALCDHLCQIPMRGAKKSFNVAIAFSIAAYQLTLA